MTIDEKVRSIESSFAMEDIVFDIKCRQRVKDILSNKISVTDAILELNEKYKIVENRK